MKFTGERILPDQSKLKLTYVQSLKAYIFASDFCKGKRVLDIGCGDGYGSAYLAQTAKEVVGLDYDKETVKAAKKTYGSKHKNLSFVHTNIMKKSSIFKEKFDVVICFQTIEHFEDVETFVSRLKSLVKRGGTCVVTTPNIDVVNYVFNPFHYQEFTAASLRELLLKEFKNVEMFGVSGDRKVTKVRMENEGFVKKVMMFDILRLRNLLPREFLQKIYAMGSNITKSYVYSKQKKNIQDITIDNFKISNKGVEKSLDLLAVCN